jgi:hypothetical protein
MEQVLDYNRQDVVMDAICHAARMTAETMQQEYCRPAVVFKPRIFMDGDQWCALYGDDLQNGVAGFGDSPDKAMRAFDAAWYENRAA